ncbi:hypothetical protein BDP27DRAFT_1330454 [Rhodocollybia butyracea]|uniref:Uncharacterized protein n=1 Tax=Rhodocollybia butyracea TaxID=206335 RepID=A0A9P5U671_9AGAR|nr:hypothetical protein BDP27DRAFT_1330454 [Rhodocollybia butyracea]
MYLKLSLLFTCLPPILFFCPFTLTSSIPTPELTQLTSQNFEGTKPSPIQCTHYRLSLPAETVQCTCRRYPHRVHKRVLQSDSDLLEKMFPGQLGQLYELTNVII